MNLSSFYKKTHNRINRELLKLRIKIHERVYKGVHYVYFPSNSDTVVVGFSAFQETKDHKAYIKKYNYINTLQHAKEAKLFIIDEYGWGGAYYIINKKNREPEQITDEIIELIMQKYHHTKLITIGSSKGGTAALYHGLKLGAEEVITGACQYYLGYYLVSQKNFKCIEEMLGKNYTEDDIKQLDNIVPSMVHEKSGQHTKITIVYSKMEHTYPEHIHHMLNDLYKYGYNVEEHIETFTEHTKCGFYHSAYLESRFINNVM